MREGSIRAWMNPENADVITNTGGVSCWPSPTGNGSCGNHKSHWIWKPGTWTRRSAGSGGAYSGRITATLARNSDADPDQPTRSASVAAGIVGVFTNNSRTLGANASKLDAPDAGRYFGTRSVTNARSTVPREIPTILPISRFEC
ncbi:hypothetical protein GCM10009582_14650 [Arthrobacter flavus]